MTASIVQAVGGAEGQCVLAPSAAAAPVSRITVAAFGAAGAAVGSLNAGLVFLLLIYYHRVLHLHPSLAGLALAISLVADAVIDPLVGYASDHWKSRLGRRHPFLFVAVLPLAGGYLMLWFPPFGENDQIGLFLYLLSATVVLRLALTLFDIPANALIAEITSDYETRTRLSQAKVSMTWLMVNIVSILTFTQWLADAPGAPPGSGLLNKNGYHEAAMWISGLVFIAALSCPLALMRHIPALRANSERNVTERLKPAAIARNLIDTYRSRAVLALLLSATFFAAAGGLQQSLWLYIQSSIFGLGTDQIIYLQYSYLLAAVTAMLILPRIARGKDKRRLAIRIAILYWPFAVLNVTLRLCGLAPDNGSDWLLPLLCTHGFVDGLLLNMLMALILSMLSDAVESNFVRTGRREEGVILAGQTFVTKSSVAIGTLVAGALLSAARFPQDGAPASADVIFRLGLAYTPCVLVIGLISLSMLARYNISRSDHLTNAARAASLAANSGA
jgi:Na+/melibiose symporter-like transporter